MSLNDRTVQVGLKKRHLKIPENYELITKGYVKEGDMFANVYYIKWQNVDILDIGTEVKNYDYIIRKTK